MGCQQVGNVLHLEETTAWVTSRETRSEEALWINNAESSDAHGGGLLGARDVEEVTKRDDGPAMTTRARRVAHTGLRFCAADQGRSPHT